MGKDQSMNQQHNSDGVDRDKKEEHLEPSWTINSEVESVFRLMLIGIVETEGKRFIIRCRQMLRSGRACQPLSCPFIYYRQFCAGSTSQQELVIQAKDMISKIIEGRSPSDID